MIPKIAHFIWFGPRPSWVDKNIELFRSYHPKWKIKVHGETPDWIDQVPEFLKKTALDANYLTTRSDILRYGILKKEGGVYLDVDILTLRPIDDLLQYECFISKTSDNRVNGAVIGSIPNSDGISQMLEGCDNLLHHKYRKIHRASLGPKMLTRMVERDLLPAITVLPYHYFYLFVNRSGARYFQRANKKNREMMVDALRDSFVDKVEPYLIHLWGVDRSSNRRTYKHGDALVQRLRDCFNGQETITGAEIGTFKGKFSEHLLWNCPKVKLYMIDRWCAANPDSGYAKSCDEASKCTDAEMQKFHKLAEKRTDFASNRRVLMQGESAFLADDFDDDSLDFVFIDADHTYEGVLSDLEAWFPKVRSGGLISGHDIDNPLGNVSVKEPWAVRRAITNFTEEVCPQVKLEIGEGYTFFFRKP